MLDQDTTAKELLDLDLDITSLGDDRTGVAMASTMPIPGCP